MKPTHQKRPYLGVCREWNGTNFDEIHELLKDVCRTIEQHGEYIQLRVPTAEVVVQTLYLGDWVVMGENGEVKTYSPEEFHIKYEVLP